MSLDDVVDVLRRLVVLGGEVFVASLRAFCTAIKCRFCAECVFVDYAGSGTLTARFSAVQYVGALFQRAPKAITKVAGTAMTASVFS